MAERLHGSAPMLDVLLVDDDDIVRGSIADALEAVGHHVVQASDGAEALSLLSTRGFDLAVCDVQMPKVDGLTLFRRMRREAPSTAVVIMTSFAKIPDVVGTLRDGAVDYVTKPFDPDVFASDVVGPISERRAIMKRFEEARTRLVEREAGGRLVGDSVAMRQLAHRLTIASYSDTPLVVWGEKGSGKKLAARTIHAQSARRDGPFVVIPCSSLPDRLRESENDPPFFVRSRRIHDTWFRGADRGTLVLDGIDELPLPAQHELLRVVDEPSLRARRSREMQPLGVRLVCVARQDPQKWIRERGFLEALFFRLNAMQIGVPSLAQREGDLYLLTCHFLRELTTTGRRVPGIGPDAWEALSRHRFGGNVRELFWALQHAAAAADGREIALEHLPESLQHCSLQPDGGRPA
jgi:DNA-binding NtrC family response regulator